MFLFWNQWFPGATTREKIRNRSVGEKYASHQLAGFHLKSRTSHRLATSVPKMASHRRSRSLTRRNARRQRELQYL